jgi:DNA-directed RNA polymerase specialized sigma24 family protein
VIGGRCDARSRGSGCVRLPERFAAFYEREDHWVVGFAYAVAGSWEAAEDATQEAFLRAHRHWERVGPLRSARGLGPAGGRHLAVSAFWRRLAEGRALVRLAARPRAHSADAAGGPGLLAGGPVLPSPDPHRP